MLLIITQPMFTLDENRSETPNTLNPKPSTHPRSKAGQDLIEQIKARQWGIIVLDEVWSKTPNTLNNIHFKH
jgi:hypothetical protein